MFTKFDITYLSLSLLADHLNTLLNFFYMKCNFSFQVSINSLKVQGQINTSDLWIFMNSLFYSVNPLLNILAHKTTYYVLNYSYLKSFQK